MKEKSRIIRADAAGIAAAAAVLDAGGIVAVPTETVYGLAARAGDAAAVARIYAAKGRPAFNPLIVHVGSAAMAAQLVKVSPQAAWLMAEFWPGALTLVLPLRPGAAIAPGVTAGLATLAVRCPAHPVMQALIARCGPLAAPSANASGGISSTTAAHVAESLAGRLALILDAGRCSAGLESTIVAVEGDRWRLLRPGAVPVEHLPPPAQVRSRDAEGGPGEGFSVSSPTGPSPGSAKAKSGLPAAEGGIEAPGMLASHYAPRQPVRPNAVTAHAHEFHIGFGAIAGDASLSLGGDLGEAATRLFDLLHIAQASGRAAIAVAPVPETGLGAAINDRLRRAAAPR
jgi:L-threonylcarbamoyladenylate synthase